MTYQWLRDGVAIAGATETSYELTGADLGRTLTVRSTAQTSGYPDFSGLSAAKAVPKARASVALRLSATRAKVKSTRLYAVHHRDRRAGAVPDRHRRDVRRRRTGLDRHAELRGMRAAYLPVFSTTGQRKVQVRYSGDSRVDYRWSPAVYVTV